MSAFDLLDDTFPHGTSAGFAKGCRSNGGCQNHGTDLQTCRVAEHRMRADWKYQQLVKGGMSEPDAGKEVEKPEPKVVVPAKKNRKSRARTGGRVKVTAEQDGFPHGTSQGYRRGCHTNAACPNDAIEGALTCGQAKREEYRGYGREYSARKRQEARDLQVENERLRAELAELRGAA